MKDFLPHVKERLEGTVKYGVVADPDMEALLASKPDYIFIDSTYSGADLAKFEKSRLRSPSIWMRAPGATI
ncbi:hypothetical protein HMSSN036_52880 [Paenibacillus macerans]|nr:hypothetical protein HMSSN036_52880 [Paenibacillus macerans]